MEDQNKYENQNYAQLYQSLLARLDAVQAEQDPCLYQEEVQDLLDQAAGQFRYLGQEVIVNTVIYLVNCEGGYTIHNGNRNVYGVAWGLRFDPGITGLTPLEDLRLQLVVEGCDQLKRLVPLLMPHAIIAF